MDTFKCDLQACTKSTVESLRLSATVEYIPQIIGIATLLLQVPRYRVEIALEEVRRKYGVEKFNFVHLLYLYMCHQMTYIFNSDIP